MASDTAWLQALKPGDTVIVRRRRSMERDAISKVDRWTPSRAYVIVNGQKFRAKDGWEPGTGYHHDQLEEATEEALAQLRRERAQHRLVDTCQAVRLRDVNALSLADCERLLQLLADYGLRKEG